MRIWAFNQCGQRYLHGAFLKTVNSLAKAGHAVTASILAPRQEYLMDGRDRYDEQVAAGVRLNRIRLWSRYLPKSRWGQGVKLIEFYVRQLFRALTAPADLFIAYDVNMTLPVWLAARIRRKPYIYFALELYAERTDVDLPGLWRRVDTFICPRSEAIVAVDDNRARYMVEAYGARQKPVVLNNTPPFRTVVRGTKFDAFLRECGSPARKVALYQGQVHPFRGIDQLVEAGRYIDDDIAIVILGPIHASEYGDALREKIADLGLERRVLLHPAVMPEEVWEYTASAHAGVMVHQNVGLNVYYNAGATNKFYEFLMCGVPVVAPNFPGFPEIVEAERVGRCIDPTDPKAIAGAINEVVRDDAEWEAMRQRALVLARDRFNWEIDFEKLHNLCKQLTGDE